MRLIIIILTVTIMQASAATGYAQKVTLSKTNASIVEVFLEINKQTGYNFLYTNLVIKDAKPINLDVKDKELEEVLDVCFSNQPFTYSIENKSILVKEKKPTFLDRLAKRWASIDCSGRIVDSDGKALPGASVKVKATGKAVSTDGNGKFFLRGVEEGAVLVVSFIGYLPKEVSASANMGDVALEPSLSKLDGWVFSGGTASAIALPWRYSWKYS